MADRRTFLALLGAATGAAALDRTASEQPVASAQASVEPPEDLDPAEALLAYVEALYGDRLDEEDLEVVLAGIEGSLDSAAAFREVGLENADEPAYGFSAYRGGGR
ncbi:MAG: hypothetical protein QXG03_14000 [Halalkalicoccus sp.]